MIVKEIELVKEFERSLTGSISFEIKNKIKYCKFGENQTLWRSSEADFECLLGWVDYVKMRRER